MTPLWCYACDARGVHAPADVARVGGYRRPVDIADMRGRVADARVGRLATVSAAGKPHVVPVCFAVLGDTVFTAVDAKPKRSTNLQRLANIGATGVAALLVDEYDEDWSQLWWVRADARGRLVEDQGERQAALAALTGKYRQYQAQPPPGPVLHLDVFRWTGWAARELG
jgi:PPOX class probable F420-dependent enzyme